MKKSKNNAKKIKKVIEILAAIALVCVIFLFCVFSYDLYQKKVLTKEANQLSSFDFMEEEMDMNIKTKGSYGKVEKAMKQYVKDFYDKIKTITNLLEDEKFQSVLSIQNYQEDGKEFLQTKTYLEEVKKTVTDNFQDLLTLTEEKEILSYIKKENVSSYYQNLYQDLMLNESIYQELEDVKKETQTQQQKVLEFIEIYQKVIQLLSENKDEWSIENDQIIFNRQELLNTYNTLVSQMKG